MATMKRNPSSVDEEDDTVQDSEDSTRLYDEAQSAEESAPSEPLDIEAKDNSFVEPAQKPFPAEKEAVKPGMNDQDRSTIARTITGATPALMGLLMGASPAMAESQIKEGQAYYSAGTPKKTVLTMGPDGKPVYTDIRDSIGKQAYTKPLKAAGGGAGIKMAKFIDPRHPEHVVSGFFDPITKTYRTPSETNPNGDVVLGAYEPEEFGTMTSKTAGNTDVTVLYNKRLGLQGPNITGPIGEAALKGQGAEQYKIALDLSKQLPKEIAPIQQKVAYANAALQTLASNDKDTQAQGALLAQQYLQDAKSNQNVINVVNPGMFDKLSEMATRIATGKASANEINALAAGVQQVADAQKSSINAIGSATAQAAGPEAAKMMSQNIYKSNKFTPQMPTVPASQHPQAKEAIDWANKNPNTEQAKEIYKRFGR